MHMTLYDCMLVGNGRSGVGRVVVALGVDRPSRQSIAVHVALMTSFPGTVLRRNHRRS